MEHLVYLVSNQTAITAAKSDNVVNLNFMGVWILRADYYPNDPRTKERKLPQSEQESPTENL